MQQTSVQKQKKSKKIGGFSMFKKMKHMKNEKGLTLIELLAVIVILAIIAAIAIPAIGNIINNQREKSVLADISGVVSAAKIAVVDGNCTSATECNTTDLADFVNAKGFKDAGDKVELTTVTNPKITYTFAVTEKIKVDSKIGNKIKAKYADWDGTKVVLTESELNEIMGK